ncbi:hypothetical protein GGI21_003558, partial [Coemansia aciculifera]
MHTNTPFQLLPGHIVKSVVDYVVKQRLRDDGVDNTPHEHDILMPLLWVCHNFRAYVYPHLCRNCELDVRNDEEKSVATSKSWRGSVGGWAQNLAKELTIVVDLWSIYTGEALRKLSIAPYKGCAFPLVFELSLDLSVDSQDCGDYPVDFGVSSESTQHYPPETATNIAAFVLRVKEMLPAISKL